MNRGFTLVELLGVIVIIGLLSGIILPQINGMREKGRDTERITDVKKMQTSLERYFDRNGEYPDVGSSKTYAVSGDSGDPSCYSGDSIAFPDSGLINLVNQGLISSLPRDPINESNHCYLYRKNYTCSGNMPSGQTTGYVLLFKPENFDTFGGDNGGENGALNWDDNNDWLCVES
ncbi:MAG: prepilin-type N-terminal cleavage/methylation domain-containing protein [Candidatus Campbellbacteria bacterium]|nr:prepilin-type N-terminal cleavage/methylation domain-containing protein [Candidatus Campbellbacteria bacterium]